MRFKEGNNKTADNVILLYEQNILYIFYKHLQHRLKT